MELISKSLTEWYFPAHPDLTPCNVFLFASSKHQPNTICRDAGRGGGGKGPGSISSSWGRRGYIPITSQRRTDASLTLGSNKQLPLLLNSHQTPDALFYISLPPIGPLPITGQTCASPGSGVAGRTSQRPPKRRARRTSNASSVLWVTVSSNAGHVQPSAQGSCRGYIGAVLETMWAPPFVPWRTLRWP